MKFSFPFPTKIISLAGFVILLVFYIQACSPQPESISTTKGFTFTSEAPPGATDSFPSQTPALLPSATSTIIPSPTHTSEPIPSQTITITPTDDENTNSEKNSLVIDHRDVDRFDKIPNKFILKASEMDFFLRHASVGHNLDEGLNCLMNNFADRPNYCDRGLSDADIFYDPIYDRTNWIFEFHAEPNPNPGWINKTNYFIERVNNFNDQEQYDAYSFLMCYVDATDNSDIAEKFFSPQANDKFPGVDDLEFLDSVYPETELVWWTLCLARAIGTANSDSINQQIRDYAIDNNIILFDIADIESHTPDGTPCIDNRGEGYAALCQEYTTEKNGGHLNPLGTQRLAMAFWVLMARLSGWDGN